MNCIFAENAVPNYSRISMVRYNSLGREISVIFEGYRPAGVYTAQIDGYALTSGVYFLCLETTNHTQIRKLILLK
ncbi:MAG: T9SS type A sorting domain-containing protein [FCB group bacterium]|nr:T9SS type A sorting domain-containing protein [FCB group bacterium]